MMCVRAVCVQCLVLVDVLDRVCEMDGAPLVVNCFKWETKYCVLAQLLNYIFID